MIDHIKRTQPLRPSKIGLFTLCPLRYLCETERPKVLRLQPSPYVYLGIAFHNSIDHFWGNLSIPATEVREWIRNEFARQIQKEQLNVTKWSLQKYKHDLLLSQTLLNDATRLAFQQIRSSPSNEGLSGKTDTSEVKKTSVEEGVISAKYDISGRADLIEVTNDHITVVDFKLGLSLSEDGQPDLIYVRQLSAYALALDEKYPNKKITLELRSPKRSISIEFNRQLKEEISNLVTQMRVTLPKDTEVSINNLGIPGEHCKKCTYRPSCKNYNEQLTGSNITTNKFISNFDLYGVVNSVKVENGLINLEVINEISKNKIQVNRIPVELFNSPPNTGDQIYLYDLSTQEVLGKGKYIANFQVINSQDINNSAFSFVYKCKAKTNIV